MAAVFEVVTSGIENLQKAVKVIEASTLAQERLAKESNDLTRAMRVLVTDGFNQLAKAQLANIQHSKAATAQTQAQITSVQKLVAVWKAEGGGIAEVNTQLAKQASQSQATSAAIRTLTLNSNAHIKAAREMFLAAQAETAMINKQAAGYAKIAGLMAERASLESGVAQALTVRAAREQALLAIEQQRSAVAGITLRNIQTRIVAESALTNAQKMRALAEMGLVDLNDKGTAAVTRHAAATSRFMVTQRDLHSALRGVGAAMDSLFLTYGNIIPMVTAFLATMTGIKSLKIGAEFEAQAVYIHELQDAVDGAVISLEGIERKLLDIRGVGKTPSELADAVKELVKAGIPAAEAIENVGYMAKFATVVETDMAKASELVTSQWLAWGPASQAAGRGVNSMNELMDLLAATVVKTKAGMEDLRVAVKYLTPLAGASKATYVELLALAGALANIGLEGSMGTTAVRTGLMRLSAQAEQTAERFAKLGVNFNPYTDSTRTKMKQGLDMLKAFFVAVGNLKSETEQADMIFKVLGLRATQLSGLGLAMGGVASKAELLKEELLKVQEAARMKEGFVGTVFEKLTDTAIFKIQEMKAALQRAMAEAFDSEKVKESFDRILNVLNSGAFERVIATLSTGAANVIEAFSKIASVGAETLATVLSPLGKILIAMYALRAATALWNGLLMMNPIIRGAVLVGSGLVFLDTYLNKLRGINTELRVQNSLAGKTGSMPLQRSHSTVPTSDHDFNSILGPASATEDVVKGKLASAHAQIDATVNKTEEANQKITKDVFEAVDEFTGGVDERFSNLGSSLETINIDALSSDIDRFLDRTGASSSRYAAQVTNEVDGYIEKAEKLAVQNKTSLESTMALLGTTEAEIRKAGEAKIIAFNTEQTEKFNKSIRDINVDLEALSGKTGSTDKFEIGMARVTKQADELKNKIKDLADEMVKEGKAESYADALKKIAEQGGHAGNALDAVAASLQKAETVLANSLIDDYEKSFRKLTNDVIQLTPHQKKLNDITEKYTEMRKDLAERKSAYDTKGIGEYNAELQKLNALEDYELKNNTELLKSSENLWSGFKAGVIEAKNELKTLGTLGNEIFKDLQGGIKGAFSGLLKGDTSAVGKSFDTAFKAMGDHAVDYMADKLTGMTTDFLFGQGSMFGGLLDSFGMGGMFGSKPTGAAGSPLHVVVDGGLGLGGGMGGLFGNGFTGAGAAGWVNPDGISGMAMLGGGLAMAGGAYGMYAGAKNLKEGNIGTGALQAGLGGAAAYQGAVTLGFISPGAATSLATAVGAKLGIGTGIAAATGTGATAAGAASLSAAEAAYLGGQGAAGAAAAPAAITTAPASAAAPGAALSGSTVAAAAAYAVPVLAAGLAIKGIWDKSQRPSASAEIDEFGVTPEHLRSFTDQVNATNGSILATVPTLQKYNEAIYDSESQILTLSNGTKQLQLQYDAAAQAGHQWSSELTGGTSILTSAGADILRSFSAIPPTVDQVHTATGMAVNAFSQLSNGGESAGRSVNQLQTYLQGMGLSATDAAAAAQALMDNVGAASGTLNNFSVAADKFGNTANGAGSQVDQLSSSVDQFGNNSDGSARVIASLSENISALGSATSFTAGVVAVSANTIRQAYRALDSMSSENMDTSPLTSSHLVGGNTSTPSFHAKGGMLQGGSGRVDDLYLGTINGRAQIAMGGEYIINPRSSKKHKRSLDMINADRYADGGQLDSLMSGVDDTIAEASMISFQFSLRKVNQEYEDLIENLEEQGASVEQITRAQQALGIETGKLTEEFSKGIKDLVLSMQDTIIGMRDNSVPSQLRQIEQDYAARLEQLTEIGAGPHLRGLAAQEYNAKKAQAYGGGSDTAKDLLKEAQDVIRKAAMQPADYEKYGVDTQWQDKLKALAESGGTPAQRGALIQAYRTSLKELADAPLKEAVTSLDSFKKGLEGTTDELQSSQQAQQKLFTLLTRAQTGNFSGLDKVSDFLGDISIKKADYATAADYARDYWRTMSAASQLQTLAQSRVNAPAFASGGYHVGGYRLVGENGPEVEYTGPARIANRDQLIDISALLEELRQLRQSVNSGNFAVARNTQKAAESLKRMEYDGINMDAGAL